MNLQPLYDVKSRLEQAAIAGTGLLAEDFRLRRAGEELKPLAAASPVFGKIHQGLAGLLAAPREEQGGLLLDLLALTDAVVYTQGVSRADGALEPLPPGCGVYLPLSYSQLNPLLAALTGKGGGRQSQVKDIWEAQPAFFGDYRVLPALISGLGDSYGELAELNAQILKGLGPAPLPLLKEGFDPAGKKDMARWVEVISAIEGAAAAPWLREVLPQSKKSVRAAVIEALGENPENASLLLELAQTERGAQRETVLWALAKQDREAVRDFWTAEVAENPAHIMFLKHSRTDWASDLAAAALRREIETFFDRGNSITPEDRLRLNQVRWACTGKTSPAMLDCWRWMDSVLNSGELTQGASHLVSLSGEIVNWLLDSLYAAGPSPLCDLCRELWDKNRDHTRYLPHALLAALITRPAAEVYETFSPYLERSVGVRKASALKDAFGHIFWDKQSGCYRISHNLYDILVWTDSRTTALAEPLDRRWFGLLFKIPDFTNALRRLIPPEDPELCDKLAVYQYRAILNSHFLREDVEFLRDHGWTKWQGFLDRKVRRDGSLTVYAVANYLNATSLTGPEKAEELLHLEKIVQEQHAANKRPLWPAASVQKQIAAWNAECTG